MFLIVILTARTVCCTWKCVSVQCLKAFFFRELTFDQFCTLLVLTSPFFLTAHFVDIQRSLGGVWLDDLQHVECGLWLCPYVHKTNCGDCTVVFTAGQVLCTRSAFESLVFRDLVIFFIQLYWSCVNDLVYHRIWCVSDISLMLGGRTQSCTSFSLSASLGVLVLQQGVTSWEPSEHLHHRGLLSQARWRLFSLAHWRQSV